MPSIDVIIPTLGRPEHLRNVLADLAAQTLPPHGVFVIEQDPRPDGVSELAHLAADTWPFALRHHYVRWVGACRARNLALREATADWVLFLDDDVRFPPGLLSYVTGIVEAYGCDGANPAVYLAGKPLGEEARTALPAVWPTFGTCTGLMRRTIAQEAGGFDESLEGGFGEDWEFAIRCRRLGASILYAPEIPVLHLKAPAGGFRFAYPHPWLGAAVQPRPSPTVMRARRTHYTRDQERGYRLAYALGRLAQVSIIQLPGELRHVLRQWRASVAWAGCLAKT